MAEFGTITPQGTRNVIQLVMHFREDIGCSLPDIACAGLLALAAQLENLQSEMISIERQLMGWHRQNAASQSLKPSRE